ncbi:unnamed protein product [Caenorhabditis angaria]|uniref:Ell-associated factor Eaf n=1 Tax=Caenorhabditis angaria TaxID=860376 RepID=A0A9P1I6Q5_9PELO|nr:unnamed protein product [Caenorhabditis angaria]
MGDIPCGTYTVELGKSFQDPKKKPSSSQELYTSIKYDFKPSSVSDQPETYIAVGNNGDVHVALDPENLTVFKGAKKEAKKECYLFFDSRTNTVRLEQISSNIQVKKTRDLDPATEQALRTGIERLRTSENAAASAPMENNHLPTISPPKKERKESSSSSSSASSGSGSDSSSDESDDDKNKNDDDGSSDDDSELLEKLAAKPQTSSIPSRDYHPPHHHNISMPNITTTRHNAPDCQQLGLNLSESSDED